MYIFVDWRIITFVILFVLIMAAFLGLVIHNAVLLRGNQVLKKRVREHEAGQNESPTALR